MSKTTEINALKSKLDECLQTYHDSVDKLTRSELYMLSDEVQVARDELSACISEGAIPCPECEVDNIPSVPIGMILREEYVDKTGLHPRMYEVGCLLCNRRAQSADAEDAVVRWNAEDYLVKPTSAE